MTDDFTCKNHCQFRETENLFSFEDTGHVLYFVISHRLCSSHNLMKSSLLFLEHDMKGILLTHGLFTGFSISSKPSFHRCSQNVKTSDFLRALCPLLPLHSLYSLYTITSSHCFLNLIQIINVFVCSLPP